MVELSDFLNKNPLSRKIGKFSVEELNISECPIELIDFLTQEQKNSYGNNFFWTISPSEYHDVLNNWGLDGKNCFAFLRSSFGCITFFSKQKYWCLNCQDGSCNPICGNHFDMLMNMVLCDSTNLNVGFCYDLHLKYCDNLPELKEDEMYTLVPALPLGGDMETSKVQVVKLKVQLDILAQLYNHKTTN
jgi:hypothetical protein